jgi:hypothetical protein
MYNGQANQRRRDTDGPAARNERPLFRDSERGLNIVLGISQVVKQSGMVAEFKFASMLPTTQPAIYNSRDPVQPSLR